MAEGSTFLATKRYAVVTGANKGIGFELCRNLASKGITVVLTSRDEKRGLEAAAELKDSGLSDLVVFHQLDVTDPSSIASLADFVKSKFGKLDILVNNAGIFGAILDPQAFANATELAGYFPTEEQANQNEIASQSFELAEECLKTNYHGARRMIEAFVPLLQLSDSARIVNVSSIMGLLKNIPNPRAKKVLSNVESLTEDGVDEVLRQFLKDFKDGLLKAQGWPTYFSAYTLSKAAMNAYTRILAKKHPSFLVNSIGPGFVKTDITCKIGVLTAAEGAENVARLALLSNDGPSVIRVQRIKRMAEACDFLKTKRYAVVTGANKGIGFEICKQLASRGVTVVLTARDENRGLEALEKLKESGLSDHVVFHQLDVTDPVSIASIAAFIRTQFGKLDILVNNAAINGVISNYDNFARAVERFGDWPTGEEVWNEIIIKQTYELAEDCLNTNYYGMKRMVEALAPFLQLADSARIVNITSYLGVLHLMSNEWAKGVLSDVETLTEERVEEVLSQFLDDFKHGTIATKGWQTFIGPTAYSVSKAAMNAYTRILAKKYPSFCINCVAPGFVKTDITGNAGYSTAAEGAEHAVRLALLPIGGSSGLFFNRQEVSHF
ncbi:hypothetical protein DITRI_Ditri11bG0155700 [Diplodiscus trichospermus]